MPLHHMKVSVDAYMKNGDSHTILRLSLKDYIHRYVVSTYIPTSEGRVDKDFVVVGSENSQLFFVKGQCLSR